jgi:hypothetical protein
MIQELKDLLFWRYWAEFKGNAAFGYLQKNAPI